MSLSYPARDAETTHARPERVVTWVGMGARRRRADCADDHREQWLALRAQGATYREIGEAYGFSHERVRQLVGQMPVGPRIEDVRRRLRAERVAGWLSANGPVTPARLAAELQLTVRQLRTLATQVPDVAIPLHLILAPGRPGEAQFSDDDLIEALQEVWTRLPETRRHRGMSSARFARFRAHGQPSPALVINRFGTWEKACEAAGVTPGGWMRPKESYASRWSDAQMLDAVATYARDATARSLRPTYAGYERFQKEHAGLPSGTTVRIRLRVLGLTSWPAIVNRALRQDVAL